ncbi:origin recognition complex subunit 4 C-terminus-domain-containing protein [Aspergillus ambiguus]|uniref:origin recognition complex subunit 4 n=1 Tax=Aspergillus ambiguus TaxID=176160 RepID=UPI003CCDA86F
MKDPRAGKRRRVSDDQNVDADGDIAMGEETQDLGSGPSASPTPQVPEHNNNDTPSKSGLRSSGRQRKAPQRFEEDGAYTPSRRSIANPGQSSVTRRSSRRKTTRQETETQTPDPDLELEDEEEEEADDDDDDDDDEPEVTPPPSRRRAPRTRSARSTAKTTNGRRQTSAGATERQSPSPEDYPDGLDDLVSDQLRQDLLQPDGDARNGDGPIGDPLPAYGETFQGLVQSGLTEEVRALTGLVLEKLNGKRPVPLQGLESEYQKVYQLIEQTVTVGEGNSMLLLGSRGCGKTAIVESTISSLARTHRHDFHVVRLNGFLHTDDRLALREMWRQLGRETNTEEEAGKVTSYADTMSTLLALLSHPEEIYGASANTGAVTAAKSVVIILDEFDLFVTHPRQTLLYNLFDIAQARKAPVAVLGLTTKVDVTEMLEKRVKSRFSHRYVFVPLPRTFDTFSDICYAGLNLDDEELTGWLEDAGVRERPVKSDGWKRIIQGWRAYLQSLWGDEAMQSHLRRIYSQTKSAKEFFTSTLIAMTEFHYSTYDDEGSSIRVPTAATFSSQSLSCPDPAPLPFAATTTVASSPSSLPLSLLLAATRLAALYDPNAESAQPTSLAPLALSFPAAYAEYVRLLTSAKTSASISGAAATPGRVWGRDVAREAWEKLVSWGLISPVGGGSGTADGRMFRVEISFEEVVEMAGSGGSLGRWWRDG